MLLYLEYDNFPVHNFYKLKRKKKTTSPDPTHLWLNLSEDFILQEHPWEVTVFCSESAARVVSLVLPAGCSIVPTITPDTSTQKYSVFHIIPHPVQRTHSSQSEQNVTNLYYLPSLTWREDMRSFRWNPPLTPLEEPGAPAEESLKGF